MASQLAQQTDQGHQAKHSRTTCARPQQLSRRIGKVGPLVVTFCLAILFLAGCVDDVPALVSDDPVLQQGREVYVAKCVSCHGPTGAGGVGSKLDDGQAVMLYPDIADQVDVVANGKGRMASFKDTLDEGEIEAVVRYTREGL